MKEKVKNIAILIIGIASFTSLTVSAATLINSREVIYDNAKSGLESTTVQEAVDELYSAATNYSDHEQRLIALEQTAITIDKVYPKGSIYMSAEDDTIEKVEAKFGGTWQRYAEGRTLVGVGTGTDSNGTVKVFNKNESLGEYNHTILTSELPNHDHSIPSLSVSTWQGSHYHTPNYESYFYTTRGTLSAEADGVAEGTKFTTSGANGGLMRTTRTAGSYVTVSGQTTTESTTGTSGRGNSINITQPYITVYMYKRVN